MLLNFVDFNPKETLARGTIAKKIAMEQLQPFTRKISGHENSEYNGGTKFRNNDTLLARITPCLENGKTAKVSILDENEVGFGSTEYIVLRAKQGISDPDFIYYLAISPTFRDIAIKSMVGTTGRQRVQQDVLAKADLQIPDLPTQRAIGKILSCLDDKIELNAQINQNLPSWEDYYALEDEICRLERENQNLEAQAKAIFKSWFIDFEPFQDEEFIDSELGKIPKGWRVGNFSCLINNTLGGDWGTDTPQGNNTVPVYCIRGADIPEVNNGNKGKMPIRYILSKNFPIKQLNIGDIVVEISGGSPTQSTGRTAIISKALLERYERDLICTNFCRAIAPKEKHSAFIFYYWKDLYNKNTMFSYENGTTGIKNFDLSGFITGEPIVIPPQSIIIQFELLMEGFFADIFSNGLESERLAQLRDTLLPKLMSGEIDVSEVAI